MADKPNILFFITDDQRFDTIAALGNPEVRTPNLDKLTRDGTAFTRAHIPGGTSGAVCMPARAMIHTGRSLFHLEANGERIPENHVLLGEVLQQAGYRTFGTGKWHNGHESYARSFTDGGEIMFGGMSDHWNVPVNHFDPSGRYAATANIIDNPYYDNTVKINRCDHIHPGKHSSELFCDCAADWLARDTEAAPFLMYIALTAPHDPRSMPEPYSKIYDPADIKLPDNYMSQYPFDYGLADQRDEHLAPYPRTPDAIKKHIAEYYGMISHLDHELGKVMDALKKSGKYENTIIVFTADHGIALGQHGLMGKQCIYEHSIRVPLIFAGPGIPRNERRESYVYTFDIFPTLCELAGIAAPATVEGLSLLPALRDPSACIREELYLAFGSQVRGLKDNRYKLIEYRTGHTAQTRLFDLLTDPLELINLHGRDGFGPIVDELKSRMVKYRDEWDDLEHPMGKTFWSRNYSTE